MIVWYNSNNNNIVDYCFDKDEQLKSTLAFPRTYILENNADKVYAFIGNYEDYEVINGVVKHRETGEPYNDDVALLKKVLNLRLLSYRDKVWYGSPEAPYNDNYLPTGELASNKLEYLSLLNLLGYQLSFPINFVYNDGTFLLIESEQQLKEVHIQVLLKKL